MYSKKLMFQEWGSSLPHQYLGTYCLEQDMSWTSYEEAQSSDRKDNILLLKEVLQLQQSSSKTNDIDTEQMMIDF